MSLGIQRGDRFYLAFGLVVDPRGQIDSLGAHLGHAVCSMDKILIYHLDRSPVHATLCLFASSFVLPFVAFLSSLHPSFHPFCKPLFVCPSILHSYSRPSWSLAADATCAPTRICDSPCTKPATLHSTTFDIPSFFPSLAAPCPSRGRGARLLADAPSPAFCGYPSTAPSGLGLNSHLPCGCLLDRTVPLLCWRTKGYMTLPNLASYRKHLLPL